MKYGRRLGQALFSETRLQRALAYARVGVQSVSVSLEIDPEATALHDLMWEHIIYVAGGEELAFAAAATIGFSRRIPLEIPTLLPSEGPFRMLLVIASPMELDSPTSPTRPIDMEKEIGSLRGAWDSLVQRGLMRVSILGRVPAALVGRARKPPAIRCLPGPRRLTRWRIDWRRSTALHLISHGTFKNGHASLLLENPEGRADAVSPRKLSGEVRRTEPATGVPAGVPRAHPRCPGCRT